MALTHTTFGASLLLSLVSGSMAGAANTVHIAYSVTEAGSGYYQAEIAMRNDAAWVIPGWRLEFDSPSQISSVWNAVLISHTGNHYVLGAPSWDDGSLSPGESIAPGFSATPGAPAGGPTGGRLNGVSVSLTGDSPAPPRPTPAAAPAWPRRYVAPYVDATASPGVDFVAAAGPGGALATTSGASRPVRFFNLAFVVAVGDSCVPSWGGFSTLTPGGGYMLDKVNALRALGGDVMVSFGGAAHTELALACDDPAVLAAAYQGVIDAYGLTHVDFDIEGFAATERASIDRRSAAIALLRAGALAAQRELHVWFTLQVEPSGLSAEGMYILRSALSHGARFDGVNIMAMDYGDAAAPSPGGRMGDYAIEAGQSLNGQLRTVMAEAGRPLSEAGAWRMIGITPMIGLNDVVTETFTLADAAQLRDFAAGHDVASLAFWSLGRDRQCPSPQPAEAVATCSGVVESPFAFAVTLSTFGQGCRGDFNGDGAVGVQDIFDFLAAYFGGLPGADFNGSRSVTVQDIFDFLGAYFVGCV